MKKSLLSILSLCAMVALVSCGPSQATSETKPSENPTVTETPSESETPDISEVTSENKTSSEEDITPLHTVSINLEDIPNITSGTNLGDKKTPEQQKPFLDHFNDGTPGLLASYEVPDGKSVTINTNSGKKNDPGHTYLTIGSGKNEGLIKFNFSSAIKKVEFTARAYSKFYDSYQGDPLNGVSIDSNVKLNLNVNDAVLKTYSLTSVDGQVPPFLQFEHEFEQPVTSFSFSNVGIDHNRAFIKNITLVY